MVCVHVSMCVCAVAGVHYDVINMTLTFDAASGCCQCVNISTKDNAVVEEDREFAVTLVVMETMRVSVGNNQSVITITEDDSECRVGIF